MSTNVYDWTTVTSPSEALDWFNNSIRKAAEYNVFGNKTVFEAIVLADAYPLSVNAAGTPGHPPPADGDTGPTWGVNTRFAFKARIVGNPSPHAFLPDPCDPQYETQSSFLNTSIIDSHTTFISQVGYSTEAAKRPKTGDIVEVRLRPGTNGYDLQYGNFIKVLDSYRFGTEENVRPQCMSMETLFANSPGNSGGSRPPGLIADPTCKAGGYRARNSPGNFCRWDPPPGAARGWKPDTPKDDPTFQKCGAIAPAYASLPKRATFWPTETATRESAITAIKASGQPSDIQRLMFLIVEHEQPPGTKYLNYNVAGIQLDTSTFAGVAVSDFDYMSCFRDSGNHQRIFAGFDSLARGMATFGKVIAERARTPNLWRTLSGDIDTMAEDMTWNYYRNWNTSFTPEELVQLKEHEYVDRPGERIPRPYAASRTKFASSLRAWAIANGQSTT